MSASSISQEMLHYFIQLNEAEQKSVLHLIKTFVSNRSDLTPISLEEYNRELEQADEEIEAGEFISHEEVMKRYLKS